MGGGDQFGLRLLLVRVCADTAAEQFLDASDDQNQTVDFIQLWKLQTF